MPIARSIEDTWTYQLEAERDKPGASTFTLGTLRSASVEHRIIQLYRDGKSGEAGDEVLKEGGLRGWDLKDKDGAPIPMNGKGFATDEDLRRLLVKEREELGWAAFKRNNLIPEEQD